jgi:hypothetical protein
VDFQDSLRKISQIFLDESVLEEPLREFCSKVNYFLVNAADCDGDSLIQESEEKKQFIEWNEQIDDVISRLESSVNVVNEAIIGGILINKDKHEYFVKIRLDPAIETARRMKIASCLEKFSFCKKRLLGAYEDFSRFYYKYLNCLRLYDVKNHTNVLKPQKL